MKRFLTAIVLAGALTAGSISVAPVADARVHSSARVVFDFGNVRVGYRDGYWGHDRRWHRWSGRRDWVYYRTHYRHRYYDHNYRHRYDRRW